MFTFENTKEATGYGMAGGVVPTFYKLCNTWCINRPNGNGWVQFGGEVSAPVLIELSYPIGERKEDHTVNGVLTKAQPQGAKAYEVALMIEALDDNPGEQVKEPESMIGSSEFYQSDNPQIIEPWVGDQLEDLINPVSEGCQADAGAIPGKPVFTQEMSEAGRMPKVGVSIDVLNSSKHPMFVNVPVLYISKTMCIVDNFGVDEAFHPHKCYILPIDNRTDDQKAYDDLYLGGLVGTNISKAKDIIKAIKANKIHGVKWSL